jgi:hypothetical protein
MIVKRRRQWRVHGLFWVRVGRPNGSLSEWTPAEFDGEKWDAPFECEWPIGEDATAAAPGAKGIGFNGEPTHCPNWQCDF